MYRILMDFSTLPSQGSNLSYLILMSRSISRSGTFLFKPLSLLTIHIKSRIMNRPLFVFVFVFVFNFGFIFVTIARTVPPFIPFITGIIINFVY